MRELTQLASDEPPQLAGNRRLTGSHQLEVLGEEDCRRGCPGCFPGLMTTGVGISSADEIQVEGNYATQAACLADGPHVEVDHPGVWTHFFCEQHADGLWYLYLSN